MSADRLVQMANDISGFFGGEPKRSDAVAAIASHLQRFWDPRMRRKILAHLHAGGEGLNDLSREAVESLPPVGPPRP
jgi:formate dehydrogenase subunit delta